MVEDTNPWQVTGSRNIYENDWIGVTEYEVINPSGGRGIYGKVHFKNKAIGIIPIDEDGNTYLVGQFRFPINRYSWEIPEGGSPESEDPLSCAQRELLEETGLRAASWEELLQMDMSNSVTDESAIIFIARDLTQHQASPEETEQLSVKKVSIEKAYEMVQNGEIRDSLSIAGILKLILLKLESKEF